MKGRTYPMTKSKIHIGKNGPAICRATKRACRFGEHYDSLDAADNAYQKLMEQESTDVMVKKENSSPNKKNSKGESPQELVEVQKESKVQEVSENPSVIDEWRNSVRENRGAFHDSEGVVLVDPEAEVFTAMKRKDFFVTTSRMNVEGQEGIFISKYKNGNLQGEYTRLWGEEPALESLDGNVRIYAQSGIKHRSGNLPAVVVAEPSGRLVKKEYWVQGRLHNEIGPAIVHGNGEEEYFVNGERMTKTQHVFYKWKNRPKKAVEEDNYSAIRGKNIIHEMVQNRDLDPAHAEHFRNFFRKMETVMAEPGTMNPMATTLMGNDITRDRMMEIVMIADSTDNPKTAVYAKEAISEMFYSWTADETDKGARLGYIDAQRKAKNDAKIEDFNSESIDEQPLWKQEIDRAKHQALEEISAIREIQPIPEGGWSKPVSPVIVS